MACGAPSLAQMSRSLCRDPGLHSRFLGDRASSQLRSETNAQPAHRSLDANPGQRESCRTCVHIDQEKSSMPKATTAPAAEVGRSIMRRKTVIPEVEIESASSEPCSQIPTRGEANGLNFRTDANGHLCPRRH